MQCSRLNIIAITNINTLNAWIFFRQNALMPLRAQIPHMHLSIGVPNQKFLLIGMESNRIDDGAGMESPLALKISHPEIPKSNFFIFTACVHPSAFFLKAHRHDIFIDTFEVDNRIGLCIVHIEHPNVLITTGGKELAIRTCKEKSILGSI